MIFNSLRWRLQAWHGLLLAVIVTAFGVTAYQLDYAQRLRRVDDELQKRSALLSLALRPEPREGPGPGRFEDRGPGGPPPGMRRDGPPPDDRGFRDQPREPFPAMEFRLPPAITNLFAVTDTDDFYYAVWQENGRLQAVSTNAPSEIPLPARNPSEGLQWFRSRGRLREAVRFAPMARCLIVGRRMDVELAELHRFAGWLVFVGAGVLVLGLAGGWWLSTQAIRPIRDISETADKIATGDLSQRINVANTHNELGQLAAVLNTTFSRLEKAFVQQKQFTADASHELRTPLAVLISEAQTTLARDRAAAEYRETVEQCLETAQQMRRLTESLLALARFDAGQEKMRRQPLDLATTAQGCIENILPLARAQGISLHEDLAATPTTGDPERLAQVITNLLSNAIHYNRPGGEIRVRTRSENGAAILTVADTGIGIASADVSRVFERFYRADASRARANGRSGLGLSICKAIVEAHGGTIAVQSQSGVGTTFTVRLASAT